MSNQLKRQMRYEKRKEETNNLPNDVYNVVYADPPWKYFQQGVKGAAKNHYRPMAFDKICSYINDINLNIAKNAVLFLWTTSPFLEAAFAVVKAWKFAYKSSIVWHKINPRHGTGFYVRINHEFLLICTRGSFTPLVSHYIGSIQTLPIREHSRKPDKFYNIIEALYPESHFVELFARQTRSNWHSIGNELKKFDTVIANKEQTKAEVAELADAHDSKSCENSCGFDSHLRQSEIAYVHSPRNML